MIRLQRILVPTDFSESARHALTYGLSFAREYHAELLLLHVVEVSSPYIDDHIQAVETILTELNLGDIPQLIVLNKADLVSPEIAANLARLYQGVVISAHDSETLSPLIHCLQDLLGERITEESGVSGTAAAVGEP